MALTADLTDGTRIACLSHPGINLLQQRLVYHQTRLAVPTQQFQSAFEHTYEEADLLEEWCFDLSGVEIHAVAAFEVWIRSGGPTWQSMLLTPEQRPPVRREMRKEIARRKSEA